MKIIQSFAQFDERNFYLKERDFNENNIYLSFYTFLLSYLTLNKYYGDVTMYCNQKAYDGLIKYIPYDEVKIDENKNNATFWNYYKVDTIKKQTSKFIHVDSDVFIFDRVFDDFVNDSKYNAIVQDILQPSWNPFNEDKATIRQFLLKNNILNLKNYDERVTSCGTIGMTVKVKKEYVKVADALKAGFESGELRVKPALMSMISEEFGFYITCLKHGYIIKDILPYQEINDMGHSKVGGKYGYTHMWFGSKYDMKNVKLIKMKTLKMFPNSKKIIEKYEKDVLGKLNLVA